MFVDSHAHLTSGAFSEDEIVQLLQRANQSGVEAILNIAVDPESLEKGVKLFAEYPWVGLAGATTPHDVEKEGDFAFPFFEQAARRGDLLAIGETGLDYHYLHSDKEMQRKFLIRYLRLAIECNLPVVIHCRDAFADLIEILDAEYQQSTAGGVLHCFTGTEEEAAQLLSRGWYLSFSGIVTFKKSEALREVLKTVPLSQLLIETDSPYLAPQSKRGKVNEPAFLPEIAATIAQIKQMEPQEVAIAATHNAKHLFKLKNKLTFSS